MAEVRKSRPVDIYLDHIEAYGRVYQKWMGRTDKIIKRFRDEQRDSREGSPESRFNILASNVNTMLPALFSRVPKPDVSRRYKDSDPVGRVAALIVERALEFDVEHHADFRNTLRQCVMDRLLGGRGTCWIRYEPHFAAMPGTPDDGPQISNDTDESEDAEPAPEEIEYECVPVDYVHWKDFGHSVGRCWDEVTCVWRKVYMSRAAAEERFGKKVAKRLSYEDGQDKNDKDIEKREYKGRATIYELWDKEQEKVVWLNKELGEIIDEEPDPLGLECFFPCPPPLYATITNESLVPIPDFTLYQDQANELDILADRKDGLIKALQVKGVYNASVPELARLFTEGTNGTLLPVSDWSAFAEKKGLAGAIDLVDLAPIAAALLEVDRSMESVKANIYELTGISDIIRGNTSAAETATAQQIKGQYASLRLRDLQKAVNEFATGIIRIKGEIICEHFQEQTIARMGGAEQLAQPDVPLVPQALQLLKQDALREFRIDIETDSLVQIDEDAEKQSRVDFLTATGSFLQQAAEVGMQNPDAVPLLMEMLRFGVTGFKVGKTLEGQFDALAQAVDEKAKNPQPPQPDPEMLKMQGQQQMEQAKLQNEQMKAQADAQLKQQQLATDQQAKEREFQFQAALDAQKMQAEQTREQVRLQVEMEFERWKAELDAKTKLEVAQLSAGVTLAGMQEKADNDAVAEKEIVDQHKNILPSLIENVQEILAHLEKANRPKSIVRGPDGKAIGILPAGSPESEMRSVMRGPDGKIIGVQ